MAKLEILFGWQAVCGTVEGGDSLLDALTSVVRRLEVIDFKNIFCFGSRVGTS